MTQWILCTYLLFSGVGVAAAQITTKLAQETQVTWIQDTGKRAKVKLEPIALGNDWKPVQVLQSLKRVKMVAPTLALRVDDTEALASATRVVVHASYDGLPVFDRDAVAIVSDAGIITSVRGNLPRYVQPKSARVGKSSVAQILNNYLLERFGLANITPSATQRLGWLVFGEHLYPVSEVDVLDPVGFRHFTARIDRMNGRVISLTERTMN